MALEEPTQECYPSHTQLGGKSLDVVLQVSLDISQILGDGNYSGKDGHKTGDEPVCTTILRLRNWMILLEMVAMP